MQQMRRKSDGKLAVYDAKIVELGTWELVVEEPVQPPQEPAPAPEPKQPKIPRSQRPVKPLVRETEAEQVVALFEPPVIPETQTRENGPG